MGRRSLFQDILAESGFVKLEVAALGSFDGKLDNLDVGQKFENLVAICFRVKMFRQP